MVSRSYRSIHHQGKLKRLNKEIKASNENKQILNEDNAKPKTKKELKAMVKIKEDLEQVREDGY